MLKILIFAGTTEGRNLIETLVELKKVQTIKEKIQVYACVATDYGKEVLNGLEAEGIQITAGRLERGEMVSLMADQDVNFVVDATHPYAVAVTQNIKTACEEAGKKYIRLKREKTAFKKDCVFVRNTEEAAAFLEKTNGNVLLTIGSKELHKYTEIENYKERIFARVLPMEEVLKSCTELGFSGKHLICMQGPFSHDVNKSMLKQFNCKYMVTKDTGKEGGAFEKYTAAKEAGAQLIVIGRDETVDGMDLREVIQIILGHMGCTAHVADPVFSPGMQEDESAGEKEKSMYPADWFPMFVNINNKNVVVLGAGKIAQRRIKTLLEFSCNLRIVARDVSPEVKELLKRHVGDENIQTAGGKTTKRTIELLEKEFEEEDTEGAHIVIAATNDRELNKEVGERCKGLGMLVNIADSKEECDFYFPGTARRGDLIVGITAQGKDHGLAKRAAETIRKAVKEI